LSVDPPQTSRYKHSGLDLSIGDKLSEEYHFVGLANTVPVRAGLS